jgi:hypothetical protein
MTEEDYITLLALIIMWSYIIGVVIYKLTHSKDVEEDDD